MTVYVYTLTVEIDGEDPNQRIWQALRGEFVGKEDFINLQLKSSYKFPEIYDGNTTPER